MRVRINHWHAPVTDLKDFEILINIAQIRRKIKRVGSGAAAGKCHPRRLSSDIMMTNPVTRPKVARRDLPLAWVSGMISSLMTKSMAPAAKAMPKGRTG